MTAPADTAVRPSPWPIAEQTLAVLPGLSYLWLSPEAGRPATEIEQEKYEARKLRDDWRWAYADAAEVLAALAASRHRFFVQAPVPLAAPVAAPESSPPALPSPVVPQNPIAELAAQRHLPPLGDLDAGQEEAMTAFNAAFADDPKGEADRAQPDATTVMPAADQHTEIVPAVPADHAEGDR